MPMHTGSRRPSKTYTNSNGNESKTLEILYRQQMPTLRELFPGWSREDLVAAMNEANGDLELTIGRIMEGHANQWDRVKSKKSKLPASSTGGTQNANIRKLDEQTGLRAGTTRGGKSRHGRSRAKSGDKIQRKKKENGGPLKHLDDEKEKKPSWASILKGPTKLESPVLEPTATPIPSNNISEKNIEPDGTDHDNRIDITLDSLSTNQQITKESESADVVVEQSDNTMKNEQLTNDADNTNEYVEPTTRLVSDDLYSITATSTVATTAVTTATAATTEQVGVQEHQQVVGHRKTPIRRLKQDEPVVLPGGGYGLENVSLQFGSLNLTNGEEKFIEEIKSQQNKEDNTQSNAANTLATTLPPTSSSTATPTTIDPTHPQTIKSPSAPLNSNTPVSSSLEASTTPSDTSTLHRAQPQSQQNFTSQPVSQSQQPQIQPYQQILQLQQQQVTVPVTDAHAHIYPYATYTSNTIPGNPHLPDSNTAMGTISDHYNSDGRNSVNYNDPNVYKQSPLISNNPVYSRGKYSNLQDGMATSTVTHGIMGNSVSTSTAQVLQQTQDGIYDENAASYDSYYYMPHQYQNYQHNGYQTTPLTLQQQHQPQQLPSKQPQPIYVNQNMYPVYGKQNHTNQQPYDVGMLHSSRTQGLMYDKQPYQQPSSKLPQMQSYFDTNGSHIQQHTDIVHGGGQPNTAVIMNFDKQPGLSMPQPMITHGSYQPPYQPYHHHQQTQQQQQQQQQTFHHHQSYNSMTPNNNINAYSTWQNQPQQPLFWQQA